MPDTPKPKPTPKSGPPKPVDEKRPHPNPRPFTLKPNLTHRPFKDKLAQLQRQMAKENHPSTNKRRR